MAHNKRKYPGPTPPKRCGAFVGGPIPVQCFKRVHRAGLCLEHYKGMREFRKMVHEAGMNGGMN